MTDSSSEISFREQLKQFELLHVQFTGERLGEGSYGYVEIVEISGASCAAKILHDSLVQHMPAYRQRRVSHGYHPRSLVEGFKEECTLMSKLRHPHIVQFFGICYPDEAVLPALVMEQLNTSLHDYLVSEAKANVTIPMSVKQGILLDISKGLLYIHSMNIVHRDLTAANVLLSNSLTAKIADLGMARLLQLKGDKRAARMTKIPGNWSYMPPEAYGDNDYAAEYGKPIDSFSMGHIILFTVTQEFPEVGPSEHLDSTTGRMTPCSAIERREESFRIFHDIVEADHPLSQIAMGCLQNNPDRRPTATEIKEQLEEIPVVPNCKWRQSKSELIQELAKQESTVKELERKNTELAHHLSAYQLSHQHWIKGKKELIRYNDDVQRENHTLRRMLGKNEVHYTHHVRPLTPPSNNSPLNALTEDCSPQAQDHPLLSLSTTHQLGNTSHQEGCVSPSSQHPAVTTQTSALESDGSYVNVPPQVSATQAAEKKALRYYMNFKIGPRNDVSVDEPVTFHQGLFPPPDPHDLPAPIVRRQSELEKYLATTKTTDFDSNSSGSVTTSQSDSAGCSGHYVNSPMQRVDHEQSVISEQAAEDAHIARVDTPPLEPLNGSQSKDSTPVNSGTENDNSQSPQVPRTLSENEEEDVFDNVVPETMAQNSITANTNVTPPTDHENQVMVNFPQQKDLSKPALGLSKKQLDSIKRVLPGIYNDSLGERRPRINAVSSPTGSPVILRRKLRHHKSLGTEGPEQLVELPRHRKSLSTYVSDYVTTRGIAGDDSDQVSKQQLLRQNKLCNSFS